MKKYWLVLLLFSASCFADFNQGVAAYKQGDYQEAFKIWQKIAKQKPSKQLSSDEVREAQYSLALLYLQGQGVTQSYKNTEKWLLLAANKGHAEAQSKLGNLYLTGLLGQSDVEKARLWFEKSAQLGNVNGQYNLGVLYLDGVGVAKDVTVAKKWLTAAASQGDASAKELLKEADATPTTTPPPATTTPPTAPASAPFGNTPTQVVSTETDNSIRISAPPSSDTVYYAVQLFSSPNPAEAQAFLQKWQNSLNPLLSTDKMKQSQQLFIVVYGTFASTAEAKQGLSQLPPELKKNRPWVIKMRGNHLAN